MHESDERLLALDRVNSWIAQRASHFSPLGEKDGARFDFRMKAFMELCLYLHLSQKFGLESRVPGSIRAAVDAYALSESFRDVLLYNPANTAAYIMCILPYRSTDAFSGVASYYKSVCTPLRNEQFPFQVLSHVYAHDVLGLFDPGIAEIEGDAIRLSALHAPPMSLSSTPEGPYCFTHSAFYATRFGAKVLDLNESQASRISNYMDIEISKSFTLRNIDAALEIVLARLCLFGALTERDAVVVESALSLIERKGCLLSPKVSEESVFDDPTENEWEKSYHTMIVMGLLLMKLEHARLPLPPCGDAEHNRGEKIAVAMDAIGTIYASIENGNLAFAVYVLSKLKELDESVFPSSTMVAPAIAHVESIYDIHQARRSAQGLPLRETSMLGMSTDEFTRVMAVFKDAVGYWPDR